MMAIDPDKPGLIGSLRGDGGEAWRLFVTVSLCILMVLLITGLTSIVGR